MWPFKSEKARLEEASLCQAVICVPVYSGTKKVILKRIKKVFGKKLDKVYTSYEGLPVDDHMDLDSLVRSMDNGRTQFSILIHADEREKLADKCEKVGLHLMTYPSMPLTFFLGESIFETWQAVGVSEGTYPDTCSECDSSYTSIDADGECRSCGSEDQPAMDDVQAAYKLVSEWLDENEVSFQVLKGHRHVLENLTKAKLNALKERTLEAP